MADIVLQGVTKIFGNGVCVLNNLTLSIGDGELLVMVGPSGCGKTTTLRLIAGLDNPTAGTITMGGRPMHGIPPWQRGVAMVVQKPTLAPAKSIRANLNFGNDLRRGIFGKLHPFFSARAHEQRQRESQAVEETARLLGLQDVLERRPAELSGGQLQRVALGRAIVGHVLAHAAGRGTPSPAGNLARISIPKPLPAGFGVPHPAAWALLLDEPLGQLDGPLRRQLRRELHLLHRRFPATMIYVTHDSEEALALGERIAVLQHGVLLQVDSAEALLTRPRHRFVAEFFPTQAGPMNFLEGLIVEEDAQPVFQTGARKLVLPPARGELWRRNLGKAVCLAVRPEDVCIQWNKTGAADRWPMRVLLVERRANGSLVTCEDQGLRIAGFASQADGKMVTAGTAVEIGVGLGNTWLFDPIDGTNLER